MYKIKSINKIWKKLITTIIVISLSFILIIVNNKSVASQSITGINAEISRLRSRINRVESEVRNLRQSGSAPSLPANKSPRESVADNFNNPPVINNQAIGRSDPLFERLATLLIELKEDVRDIESRLVTLEERNLQD